MSKSILYYYINKLVLIFLIFSASTTLAKMSARASMAPQLPPNYIPIEDVIRALETRKNKDLEKPTTLEWTIFAKEVMEIKQVALYNKLGTDQVDVNHIVQSIQRKISGHSWQRFTNEQQINKLRDWQDYLKNKLSNDTFVWSWVPYQMGDTQVAKKYLQDLFDDEFKKLMKMDVVIVGFGGSPLSQINKYEKALSLMTNAKEKSNIQKKMKQVKIHISNLPESHVVTKLNSKSVKGF